MSTSADYRFQRWQSLRRTGWVNHDKLMGQIAKPVEDKRLLMRGRDPARRSALAPAE
jgi:hypothetical protein